jgi:hypothetical protein
MCGVIQYHQRSRKPDFLPGSETAIDEMDNLIVAENISH